MSQLFWEKLKSEKFNLSSIENRVNADKLFVSFLLYIEDKGIDVNKEFTVEEIANFIPRGTAGIENYATYGFSIMSMLSGQKDRDYFIFTNPKVRDDFTTICNNNFNRDNYMWRKEYINEKCKINPKYIKSSSVSINGIKVRENRTSTLTEKDYKDFLLFLYFGKDKNYLENCINRAYRDFNRTLHGFDEHESKEIILSSARGYLKESLLKIEDNKNVNSQDDYDIWHKMICFDIQNIFKKYGYADFYIGQAQKWINMSLKYIFVHDETRVSGFTNIYNYCHIPIDNIILSKLKYSKFNTAWSRINDYDTYLEFQRYIRQIAEDEIPLDFEFRLFIK